MQTMGKWVLREAGVQHLKLEETVVPTPGAGEIVVRVAAVALNYRDLGFINGGESGAPLTLPAGHTRLRSGRRSGGHGRGGDPF